LRPRRQEVSEEKGSKELKEEVSDPKAKFREALEKKKRATGIRNNNISGNSKIHGDQEGGGAPKMFRRKSGSA
jgi:hypothetical protein